MVNDARRSFGFNSKMNFHAPRGSRCARARKTRPRKHGIPPQRYADRAARRRSAAGLWDNSPVEGVI
jgi:hypothetical protein